MSTTDQASSTAQRLMSRHLMEVFNERDSLRRASAIAGLSSDEITLYEPADSTTGHAAVGEKVKQLLDGAPGRVFRPLGDDRIRSMYVFVGASR
jgi:hypothetical protein